MAEKLSISEVKSEMLRGKCGKFELFYKNLNFYVNFCKDFCKFL